MPLIGHTAVLDKFRTALARNRLASTFLFVGPDGIGKRTLALQLAQALLCQGTHADPVEPCGQCEACRLFAAGNHPDLHLIAKPEDASRIKISQLLGEDNERMHAGLLHELSLRPFLGQRKIGIIDDADTLEAGSGESANCLLKTLEEPAPGCVLILLSTSLEKQLITIRSRSQIIRFDPLSNAEVAQVLTQQKLVEDPTEVQRLANLSGGSVSQALALADPLLGTFRKSLHQALLKLPINSVLLSKSVSEFIDAAGKEAPLRRARFKWLLGCAATLYHQLARTLSQAIPTGEPELNQLVQAAASRTGWDLESVLEVAELCLEQQTLVDRNANQAVLVEAWLDELSRRLTPAVLT